MRTIVMLVILVGILASKAHAKDIERSDYRIIVPDTCTVDPKDPDIDLDHMTTINLPNENTMIIMVVDDEKALEKTFDHLKENYRNKLQKAQEKVSTLTAKYKSKGVVVSGLLNGGKFFFEIVALSGKQKGFIIVSTYLESEETEARKIIQKAVDSFSIKD